MAIVLGVDIGTTAVKACLVSDDSSVLDSSTIEYSMESLSSPGSREAEVDVSRVLIAVRAALVTLDFARCPPTAVALCGQMHGIVWWSAKDLVDSVNRVLSNTSTTAGVAWSSLISWQDGRCDRAFLDTCRSRAADHLSPLCSGYGLATFAHVMHATPSRVERFDTCGTIMDLVAFALCGHNRPEQATMDTTNAFSWGAYDSGANMWPSTTVSAFGVPHEMLPKVVQPGTVVGATRSSSAFGDIVVSTSSNIPVYVPMGDHPCSVFALLHDQQVSSPFDVAMINIGTSAQLCCVAPFNDQRRGGDNDLPTEGSYSFERRPYVDNQHLYVAAALTGGNMFTHFVNNCLKWIHELSGGDPATLDISADRRQAMFATVIAAGLEHTHTTLTCRPTFGGERSDKSDDAAGQLSNMTLGNWSIGDMAAAIARGIIANLLALFPKDKQNELRRRRLVGSGNALLRNSLLQHFVRVEFGVTSLALCRDSDAAVGAALIALAQRGPSV